MDIQIYEDGIIGIEIDNQKEMYLTDKNVKELIDFIKNEFVFEGVISQNYYCYNCQSINIKTTKYKCRDCKYEGRKGVVYIKNKPIKTKILWNLQVLIINV